MKPTFRSTLCFFDDDAGAVTVDWVVLTAAIVGLGIASYTVVSGGVSDISTDISGQLSNQQIVSAFPASGPSLSNLSMRVFTDDQRTEAAETMRDYNEATLDGMIAQFEALTKGQDLSTDPYAAFADSLAIAQFEKERRLAEG